MNQASLAIEIERLDERAKQLRDDAMRDDESPRLVHRALAELHTSVEELRAAEEELREQNDALLLANAALEQERRRYAELFDGAPVGYVVTDRTGVLVQVNRAAAVLLGGVAPMALLGKPFAAALDAGEREPWRELLGEVKAATSGAVRKLLRTRDGLRMLVEGVAERGAGHSGECRFVLEDVTARERAAEATRLADDARRKDEFLALLGHELRNPLAPIRAAVELWRHHADDLSDAQRQWTVDVVSRQADHLAHLVDDLLDVSRVTHGKIRLRRAVVDLREVIEQSRDVVRAQSHFHRVELELPSEAVRASIDAVRLRQVLVNLLENALKFTPRGGRIVASLGTEGDDAVLVVRDDGVGIAKDMIERVFGVFSQGEQSLARAGGGLGLGLTLVRRLVELQGGSVAVASDGIGRGTTFTVRLPVSKAQPESSPSASDTLRGLATLRLLVVDDNVDGAQMIGHLLQAVGHAPTLAFDGASAIELFEQLRPDAVLLDLGLPDIDGLEVARHIRASAPGAHIIAITGYGDDRTRDLVRQSGIADHLLKPVELEALRRALERVQPKRT